METDLALGIVLPPKEDVTELGGPSGHTVCGWRLEVPGVTVLGCHRTAGHATFKTGEKTHHYDCDAEMFWDGAGRAWTYTGARRG